MNWGKWIVLSFVIFAAFIVTLVTICMKQDVGLVSSSYYKEELIYQQQMKRIENVSALNQPPAIVVSGNKLTLKFHQLKQVEKGGITLYRPSNAELDRTFTVKSSDSEEISFDLANTPKGMYRAKFRWTMNGSEYYHEEVIYI
jgi:hypothetical protein